MLKKFSSVVEGSVIEGQMDPAVVGKFKMTPVESSMASDLKKAAEANDSVSVRGLLLLLGDFQAPLSALRQPLFSSHRYVNLMAIFAAVCRLCRCWWSKHVGMHHLFHGTHGVVTSQERHTGVPR